jgi:NADH-quinone oxidoreductase subunit N
VIASLASIVMQVNPGPTAGGSGGSTDTSTALIHPHIEYSALLPQLIMIGGALLVLLIASMLRRRPRPGIYAVLTALTGLGSGGAAIWQWNHFDLARGGLGVANSAHQAVVNAIAVDGFSVFVIVIIASAVVIGALIFDAYLLRERLDGPEFFVLAMLSASGGMFMAAANDLLVLFLGLEVLSIALYILAGYHRRRAESGEAAIKYFVLGAFSSALFLYGIALVYGATGSTNLVEIADFLAKNVITGNGILMAGMALLLVGLGFKVAAVPFHAWTPDVYQGSPTPATGFMAATAKAAGFAGLLRIFISTFSTLRLEWKPVVWVIAVLTLLVGSILALLQDDIKRMLAYSSISHAGYVLIGLQAGSDRGVAAALFYLLAYTFMVLGSFAIVTVVGRRGDADHQISAYRGLASRRPVLAFAFTVFLLAQAGVPFTTGLWAKFYVIAAAVETHSYALAIIGMLAAAISAFYYLRVVVAMYMSGEDEEAAGPARLLRVPIGVSAALVLTGLFTIGFGLVPDPIFHFASKATLLF